MMLPRFKFVSALACIALSVSLPAAADDVARKLVRDFLNAADSYTAVFDQQLTDEEGALIEESSGEFWLQRPGRFRWQYDEPLERLIVSDGELIWLFDTDLDQVTIRSATGALEQTPAGLLVSGEALLDAYAISLADTSSALQMVRLEPTGIESDFSTIELGLRDNRLQRLLLTDRFGQLTRIDFYDIRLNPSLEDGLFSFETPAGVDVIDQTGS